VAIPTAIGRAELRTLSLSFLRSAGFWLAVVVLAGAGLRLAWTQTHDFFPLGGDGRWYLVVAANMADGRGYVIDFDEEGREVAGDGEPTAFWPPGYPLVLAGAMKLVGPGMTAVALVNVTAEAVTILLVFLLGRALAGARVGLLGAALYAVLPEPIFSAEFAMSEPAFTALFLSGLLVLAVNPGARLRPYAPLLFGLLAGLAMLTRGVGLVLLPTAALFWLLRDGPRSAGRSLLFACLGVVLLVGPWTIRNALQLHEFIPVSTNIGVNLHTGHSQDATGRFRWPEPIDESDSWNTFYHAEQPGEEARRNRIYTRRAFDYFWSHPLDELTLAGKKLYWLFRVDPQPDLVAALSTLGATPVEPPALARALPPLVMATHYTLLLLAAAALPFWIRRRQPLAATLVAVVVLWALFHVAVFAMPRYHLPLLPILSIAAAWTLAEIAAAALARRSPAD